MQYSVYIQDSRTKIGDISLSKSFGLYDYSTVRYFEKYPDKAESIWQLIGLENDSTSLGFSLPTQESFLPYTIGDQLVFRVSYYADWFSDISIEYHDYKIDSLSKDSGAARIIGVKNIYDDRGFFIETNNNAYFTFKASFEEILSKPNSVKFISEGGGELASMIFH